MRVTKCPDQHTQSLGLTGLLLPLTESINTLDKQQQKTQTTTTETLVGLCRCTRVG